MRSEKVQVQHKCISVVSDLMPEPVRSNVFHGLLYELRGLGRAGGRILVKSLMYVMIKCNSNTECVVRRADRQ